MGTLGLIPGVPVCVAVMANTESDRMGVFGGEAEDRRGWKERWTDEPGRTEMTTERRVIQAKVGLLELAKPLGNISQACKIMGHSRDSF